MPSPIKEESEEKFQILDFGTFPSRDVQKSRFLIFLIMRESHSPTFFKLKYQLCAVIECIREVTDKIRTDEMFLTLKPLHKKRLNVNEEISFFQKCWTTQEQSYFNLKTIGVNLKTTASHGTETFSVTPFQQLWVDQQMDHLTFSPQISQTEYIRPYEGIPRFEYKGTQTINLTKKHSSYKGQRDTGNSYTIVSHECSDYSRNDKESHGSPVLRKKLDWVFPGFLLRREKKEQNLQRLLRSN
ncbi:unnamed protein product [Allacma fusca]|uniref:Uncharacterized protein n=1 Tax=Allacma fusca TaxID=39272 RepID=A0A8J2KCT2_9HEXA|nr:unnamed protein product [Allacma fusca]